MEQLNFRQMVNMAEAFFLPYVSEHKKFSYKEMTGEDGTDAMVCYFNTDSNNYEIKVIFSEQEQEFSLEMGAIIDSMYYDIFNTRYLKSYSEVLLFLNVLKTVYLN